MQVPWFPGRWGSPDTQLDPRIEAFAQENVGEAHRAPEPAMRRIRASRFTGEEIARLFPSIEVSLDDSERARYSRGMSYQDLLAWRCADEQMDAPDAVAFPHDHDQALDVLRVCAHERIPVVPVGGGTSVTGAITATWENVPSIALSVRHMDRIFDLDAGSGIVHVGAGATGPRMEPELARHGWTLGHFPQSWERASIGGFIAARSSGQSSGGYGRIEDMVLGARVATPVGTWDVGGFPAASSGPDLRHLVLGSEGTLGVITSAHLRLRRRPTITQYAAAVLPGGFSAAIDAVRELTRSPMRPTVLRASDHEESRALLAMSMPRSPVRELVTGYLRLRSALPGSLFILGWEGTRRDDVAAARMFAREILGDAVWLGTRPGRSWEHGRFHGPYLRDALMDRGYLVETFETVARWSDLQALHDLLRAAARTALGDGSYVMAHISHSYDTAASLYFTVFAAGWSDPQESLHRWQVAKRRITEAIVSGGGALSHHHGVGRDHRTWLPAQIGPVGMDVLRGVKSSVDPVGIMNPGVLL